MSILAETRFPARLDSLRPALGFVSSLAQTQGFSKKRAQQIELALEEILTNICNYAYKGKEGNFGITCRLEAGGRLVLEIVDEGTPFDPLSVPDPDVTAKMDERQPGGLGIFLVKQFMDDVQYRREGSKNILSLTILKEEQNKNDSP
jgi:anti-sigma regulatory factor (Ser/Thr protein kinase)